MQNFQSYSVPTAYQGGMHLSATQLQRLFDSILSVVFAIDLDGNLIYASKSCLTVCGYTQEELAGTVYLDFITVRDREAIQEYFRKQIYGKGNSELESHWIRKDGTTIPVSWTANWDAKDKMFYCVVSDITVRKTAELQKQQLHQDILNLLNRITDCFFSVDKEWTITYRNQQTEILTGNEHQRILGKKLWECYPELIGTKAYSHFHKAMTEQTPVHFEYYFNQFKAWLSINAYPSQEGLSVFFQNINESKQVEMLQLSYEEELKDRKTYLKEILDSCRDGFIGLDEEQKVVHWNRKAEGIFGVKRYSVLRKNFRMCLTAIDAITFYEEFQNAHAEKKGGSFTIYFQQTNKWYETFVTPIYKGTSIFIKEVKREVGD